MSEELRRILCIEDHSAHLATMIDWLQRLPAKVDGARNGREAVELLLAARRDDMPYDLVIIDNYVPREPDDQISLDADGNPVPGEDQKFGLQMLTDWKVRYELLSRRTPTIVYTLWPSYEDCVRFIRAGAFDYVPKEDNEGNDQMEVLVDKCRKALAASNQSTKGLVGWLQKNIDELVNDYGGQTVALVKEDVAREVPLPGVTIDGYVLISGNDYAEVRERIIKDSTLIWASPEFINVPMREEIEQCLHS